MESSKVNDKHVELSWGVLRYSKRIILVSLFTWVGIVLAMFAFLVMASVNVLIIDEYVSKVLQTILSSSSTVTITLGCAYYLHSFGDNYNELKMKQFDQIKHKEDSVG